MEEAMITPFGSTDDLDIAEFMNAISGCFF
jgi:hypothetical protein